MLLFVLFIDKRVTKALHQKHYSHRSVILQYVGLKQIALHRFKCFKHSWIPQTCLTHFRHLYDCTPRLSLTHMRILHLSVPIQTHNAHVYVRRTHTIRLLRPITCVFKNWFEGAHAWVSKYRGEKKRRSSTSRFLGCTDIVCIPVYSSSANNTYASRGRH